MGKRVHIVESTRSYWNFRVFSMFCIQYKIWYKIWKRPKKHILHVCNSCLCGHCLKKKKKCMHSGKNSNDNHIDLNLSIFSPSCVSFSLFSIPHSFCWCLNFICWYCRVHEMLWVSIDTIQKILTPCCYFPFSTIYTITKWKYAQRDFFLNGFSL